MLHFSFTLLQNVRMVIMLSKLKREFNLHLVLNIFYIKCFLFSLLFCSKQAELNGSNSFSSDALRCLISNFHAVVLLIFLSSGYSNLGS